MEKERERQNAMLAFEREARERGFRRVAGIDEAGRGPLAGPVVSAAVILPENYFLDSLNDSKKVTPKNRESLFRRITADAIAWGVGLCDHVEIDEINILNAARVSMGRAVRAFKPAPDFLLVDALTLDSADMPQKAIVRGDALSLSIAAASIVAKVTRDRLMLIYDKMYPGYGFASHKGYGTKEHMDKIRAGGLCPIHRKTFCR